MPDITTYEYEGYVIKAFLNPNKPVYQMNIVNPQDEGHCYIFEVPVIEDVEQAETGVLEDIVSAEALVIKLEVAKMVFATREAYE